MAGKAGNALRGYDARLIIDGRGASHLGPRFFSGTIRAAGVNGEVPFCNHAA